MWHDHDTFHLDLHATTTTIMYINSNHYKMWTTLYFIIAQGLSMLFTQSSVQKGHDNTTVDLYSYCVVAMMIYLHGDVYMTVNTLPMPRSQIHIHFKIWQGLCFSTMNMACFLKKNVMTYIFCGTNYCVILCGESWLLTKQVMFPFNKMTRNWNYCTNNVVTLSDSFDIEICTCLSLIQKG